jgi:hypothetical protein
MKKPLRTPERRHQKRCAVIGNPVAMMSPGPAVPGKVTCISPESVEIVYDQVNGTRLSETERLDILAADFVHPIYLEGLPVKIISDRAANASSNPMARKRVLAFDRLSGDQRNQLQSFIYSFAY